MPKDSWSSSTPILQSVSFHGNSRKLYFHSWICSLKRSWSLLFIKKLTAFIDFLEEEKFDAKETRSIKVIKIIDSTTFAFAIFSFFYFYCLNMILRPVLLSLIWISGSYKTKKRIIFFSFGSKAQILVLKEKIAKVAHNANLAYTLTSKYPRYLIVWPLVKNVTTSHV